MAPPQLPSQPGGRNRRDVMASFWTLAVEPPRCDLSLVLSALSHPLRSAGSAVKNDEVPKPLSIVPQTLRRFTSLFSGAATETEMDFIRAYLLAQAGL